MPNGQTALSLARTFRRKYQGRSPCSLTRSLQAMRGISNLRSAEHVLLFELQDVRYVASYRLKVR